MFYCIQCGRSGNIVRDRSVKLVYSWMDGTGDIREFFCSDYIVVVDKYRMRCALEGEFRILTGWVVDWGEVRGLILE